MIRLSQLEKKHIRERENSNKEPEASDEELIAEENQTTEGQHAIEQETSGTSVLEEVGGVEVGEIVRPLCTKSMNL